MQIRYATEKDTALVLYFIKELAVYEKMLGDVLASEESIKEWIFVKECAEVIFALEDGKEVGFAVFYKNFSTFAGRAGMFLEDLFVLPEYRGKGYGKALFEKVYTIAKEQECARFEWCCLDWNKAGIDFYLSMGAEVLDDRRTYRIDILGK